MTQELSAAQSAALLDILSHYDTYAEIRDFRKPGSLDEYGPPFNAEKERPSTSPALQALVSRFLLTLPGLKDVPDDFWKVQLHEIIEAFENANLSESYDKGVIGSRKTLSTAISALIEYPVRGTYGGFANVKNSSRNYDLSKAEDLGRSFRDFMIECIYGDVLDDLVKKTAKTDKLEDHDKLTKAVHEFVLVNLASLMHFTLILSPKGQYLLKLVDNANRLVPYVVIRQTLKIGNVASMMSAMMKVVLAKMSVSSLTNWMGWTAVQDEGMNLMQQIIATVLNWDMRDLESRALKIEKEKSGISKEQLQALKDYVIKSRDEQEEIRKFSQSGSVSIVLAILANASKPSDLSESAHKHALDYLNIELSIRDRREIIQILCHSQPDHLTNLVRNVVNAYEPVIRHMHNAIDLSDTVADFQAFLTDLLKLARIQPPGRDGKTLVPTVGDFVQLLKKHQYSCHKFIHQCCKNGKELTSWYLEWAKVAAAAFKQDLPSQSGNQDTSTGTIPQPDAGDLTPAITSLYQALPEDTQKKILPVLDTHISYLDSMHGSSIARLAEVLKTPPAKAAHGTFGKMLSGAISRPSSRPSSRAASPAPGGTDHHSSPTSAAPPTSFANGPAPHTDHDGPTPTVSSDPGPGAYLARWQDLLDATPITPLTTHGKPIKASDKKVLQKSAVDVDGEELVKLDINTDETLSQKAPDGGATATVDMHRVKPERDPDHSSGKVKRADVKVVINAMGEDFRKLLGEKSLNW